MADGASLRVDPHVKLLDDRVVARAKARGLDALVYAPHFTRLPEIRARAERFSDGDLTVVPGREVFAGSWRNRKHVLAVGLESPVPDFITLEGAMAAVDRQDAAVLVPHPAFLTVSLDAADVRRYRDVIDAVEVYNPKHWGRHNQRAEALAASTGLPPFASSYAHLRGTVGEAWTALDCEASAEGITAALADGAPREVGHRRGIGHRARRRLEFAHLFYENSWEKFDRVVLRGLEPTHPDQPAYGGRFDEVGVY
ncbi:MAG: PHP-associated domain-containing protein [Halobacteriales archaeon]